MQPNHIIAPQPAAKLAEVFRITSFFPSWGSFYVYPSYVSLLVWVGQLYAEPPGQVPVSLHCFYLNLQILQIYCPIYVWYSPTIWRTVNRLFPYKKEPVYIMSILILSIVHSSHPNTCLQVLQQSTGSCVLGRIGWAKTKSFTDGNGSLIIFKE